MPPITLSGDSPHLADKICSHRASGDCLETACVNKGKCCSSFNHIPIIQVSGYTRFSLNNSLAFAHRASGDCLETACVNKGKCCSSFNHIPIIQVSGYTRFSLNNSLAFANKAVKKR